ncbi:MAG TPA: M48 family metallopeptidase [Candidatus Paceibacterota bacterium]|nr:M48 family metallopeptidase [Candidatus Paceibacterota bacterium]
MTLYTFRSKNITKTWFFISLFLVFIIFLGWLFAEIYDNSIILIIAIAIAFVQSFLSYWYSDKIILGLYKAKEVKKEDNPELYRIVENLSIAAGLPMPKIYLINDSSPNAFATGRNPSHSVVCVTTGLLEKLEKSELEGVIAHELSHIGNYDILLASVIVILAGVVSLLARWFLNGSLPRKSESEDNGNVRIVILLLGLIFAILAPIFTTLLRLAISRKREFLADANAALLTRYPEGLARALEKISSDPQPLKNTDQSTAHLFIADPFKKKKVSWFAKILMTHPPVEERIKILRGMSV